MMCSINACKFQELKNKKKTAKHNNRWREEEEEEGWRFVGGETRSRTEEQEETS